MASKIDIEQLDDIETQNLSNTTVHLLDVLILFSRRRKLIVACTLGSAILTAIIVVLIPSRFTAETVVLPPTQSNSGSSALLSQFGSSPGLAAVAGANLGIKNPGDLYVTLFRSRTVEDSVIHRFGLNARYRVKRISDARTALESHTTVSLGNKDGLITIRVTDWDPKEAANIANGYVDEYRKFSANLAITEASQRRLFFQQQLLEAHEKLAAAEEAMKESEKKTGALQIDSQARALIESAAALRAQIAAKEVQIQGMSSFATSDNPQVVEARQELTALQNQLKKLGGADVNSGSGLILPKVNLTDAGLEYIRRLRDVKFYETTSELIAKQFEMAKLDEAREGTAVQVVDVAVPPDKRSFPKRSITVVLATILGFFIGCVWSVIAEGLRRMKNNPDDLRRLEALRASLKHGPIT